MTQTDPSGADLIRNLTVKDEVGVPRSEYKEMVAAQSKVSELEARLKQMEENHADLTSFKAATVKLLDQSVPAAEKRAEMLTVLKAGGLSEAEALAHVEAQIEAEGQAVEDDPDDSADPAPPTRTPENTQVPPNKQMVEIINEMIQERATRKFNEDPGIKAVRAKLKKVGGDEAVTAFDAHWSKALQKAAGGEIVSRAQKTGQEFSMAWVNDAIDGGLKSVQKGLADAGLKPEWIGPAPSVAEDAWKPYTEKDPVARPEYKPGTPQDEWEDMLADHYADKGIRELGVPGAGEGGDA